MDLQTNDVTSTNAKLYYKVGRKQEEVIEFTSSLTTKDVLFTLSEYEQLDLRFEGGKNVREIRVESLQGDEDIRLLESEEVRLTDGTTNQEMSVIPGIYGIWVIDEQGVERHYFYEIISHNLKMDQLDLMKSALESRVLGITRDLFSQRESGNAQDGSSTLVDTVGLLMKHYNALEQALDSIVGMPIEDLKKSYQMTEISKRPTARSQRWNVTKGERYKTSHTQALFYEPKIQLDLETPENRYLKYNLTEILANVSSVARQYRFNDTGLSTQINQLKTDIMTAKQRRNAMEGSYNIDKSKNQLEFEILSKTRELEQLRKQRAAFLENQRKLKSLNAKLVYILNETWLKDIQLKNTVQITKRTLKNHYYSLIYQIYQELMTKKKDKGETPTFPFIQTSKLFEFYNFILYIELLEKQGFKWTKGWLKDYEGTKKMMFMLNAGEEIWLENEQGYRIQLIYDRFLNNSNTAKNQKVPQVITSNSMSRRPDILLNLYQQDKFLSSMIIEVKYRKLKHIYRKDIETDVMRQLMDYESLRYYNPTGSPLFKLGIVGKVVVVYPDQAGAKDFVDENYGYEFIPVEPIGFDASIKGISMIERSLIEFLEENII